jgi:RND family efflux transporter MFP subunit
MKRFLIGLAYVLAMAGIVAGAWHGYRSAQKRSSPAMEAKGLRTIPVRTAKVSTGSVTNAIKLTGALEAIRIVDVMPKISGRLETLALEDGTLVLEGTVVSNRQIIAVIDHREIAARLAQARAAVRTSQTAIETAKIVVKDRLREKNRMDKLFVEGSTTEQQRDLALTAYEQAATELVQAEAKLVQAQTAVDVIDVDLTEAYLHAPMDGVVSVKYVDPGAMVNASTRVVQIMPMEELKFLLALPGPYLRFIETGRTVVQVSSDVAPDRVFSGVIARIYPAVDAVTRTATVEVRLTNAKDASGAWVLRPGLYAEGRIVLEVRREAVILPADVLLRRGERFLAFVVKEGKAETRLLRVGVRDNNRFEIVDGLTAGEQVVVAGQHRLTDGQPVRLADDSAMQGK